MASNPGEWYAERAAEAERLQHELAGVRKVLEALRGHGLGGPGLLIGVVYEVERRLWRQLEAARYVGD